MFASCLDGSMHILEGSIHITTILLASFISPPTRNLSRAFPCFLKVILRDSRLYIIIVFMCCFGLKPEKSLGWFLQAKCYLETYAGNFFVAAVSSANGSAFTVALLQTRKPLSCGFSPSCFYFFTFLSCEKLHVAIEINLM